MIVSDLSSLSNYHIVHNEFVDFFPKIVRVNGVTSWCGSSIIIVVKTRRSPPLPPPIGDRGWCGHTRVSNDARCHPWIPGITRVGVQHAPVGRLSRRPKGKIPIDEGWRGLLRWRGRRGELVISVGGALPQVFQVAIEGHVRQMLSRDSPGTGTEAAATRMASSDWSKVAEPSVHWRSCASCCINRRHGVHRYSICTYNKTILMGTAHATY